MTPPPATGVACFGQGPGQVLGRFWAGFGHISELFREVLPLWAGFGQVLGIFGSVFPPISALGIAGFRSAHS